jgi:flavin reductase (DIM6/NTAB) family NADH-FMN oxidoreductase RutF
MVETIAFRGRSEAVDETEFKMAMRQVASSVAIVTARSNNLRNGLTATAVCSVAAMPPTMLVCVNGSASAEPLIRESGAFAINFLTDRQHGIARLFSTPKLSHEDRFAEGDWITLKTGAPILEGTVASFDCRVESRVASGTHYVYLGRVVGVASLDQNVLLYRDGSFRRLEPTG